MKKNLFYIGSMLMSMVVATGCSNEESLEEVQKSVTTVEATIESPISRTSVSEDYKMLWTKGDTFTVWGTDSRKGNMVLKGEGGSATGEFEGSSDNTITLGNGDVALFPSVESNDKTYTFKSSYTDTETDAPMYGTYNGTKFTFSHLAAMIRVTASNLPIGSAVLTISSDEYTLTGATTLDENSSLPVPAGDDKGSTITVSFTVDASTSTLMFDAPIPVQNYTNGLKLTLKVGDTTIFEKTTSGFDAAKGNLYYLNNDYVGLMTTLANGGTFTLQKDLTLNKCLTIAENKEVTIDLNGKTLTLGTTSYGIVNNAGTLVIKNGKISSSNSFAAIANWAGTSAISTTLDDVELEASYIALYNKGVWEDDKTVQDYKGTDAQVKLTVNDGSITSSATDASTNVYAVMSKDYSMTTITGTTLTGTSAAGGLYLNCAEAKLDGVTINGGTAGTAHDVCLVAGVLTTTNTTYDSYRYYYGDSKGKYGYTEVDGTYYGEVNTVVDNPNNGE